MFRLTLPFDLGDLLLTPQWPGLAPAARWGAIAALCLVPVVLVLWLYRFELRLVPRAAARGLLGLRMLVLFLLLFLVGLQPVYARDRTEGLPGRVLVAVDRSDSTEVADPQRTEAEKLRLARALRLAADLADDARLEAWAQDHDANRPVQWLADDEARGDANRRAELEAERRRAHDESCARVDRLTRAEAARRVLAREGVGLLATLAGRHEVDVIGFHQDAFDVPADRIDELFRKPDATGPAAPAGATPRAYTDLRLPLLRALERSGTGQGKVLGVVVLTDGQHNLGESPVKKAGELGERQVPVYPIALGARRPPPDAAVVSVKSPATAFKDVDLTVDVRFKVAGMKAQDFTVKLFHSGAVKQLLEERPYRHDGNDQERTESFTVRLDRVGTQTLLASVEPVDKDAKETRTDNNSRPAEVKVADEKAKVLLVDGEARWEYHYLATALQRDRRMKLDTVVFDQPRLDESLTPEELRKVGSPQERLPKGADALSEYDCVILGDVSPEQLPAADRTRLEKYVADRGGTLVVLAGKRSMPLGFPDAAAGESDPIRKMLPVEAPHALTPADGFGVALSAEGREAAFLRLGAEPGRGESVWGDMPKHFWGVVGTPKPGATTLAYAAEGPGSQPKDRGLIVRQQFGLGRVLFVGLDSTWRWRFKVGDRYHHTFWGDTIHWAAADKVLESGNEFLRLGTRKDEGRWRVEVRMEDALGTVKQDLLAGARVLRQGGPGGKEESVALVPLHRRENRPRVLEGPVPDLPPGQYAVELVIPDLADKTQAPPAPGKPAGPLRSVFTVLPPESTEAVHLETNWRLLEQVAAKSGGKVFTPEDAATLADLLVKQSVPHVEHNEQRLWQWWVLLAAVVTLLTLEWAGRKWAGLP